MKFRLFSLLFVAVLLTGLVTAVGMAQDGDVAEPSLPGEPLIVPELPPAMIAGVADPPPARDSTSGVLALRADEPADSCEEAPEIALLPNDPADGIQVNVKDFTEEGNDPILSCMWGQPSRASGYRTVWYKLIVPASGRINFDTFSSTYDTVLGVFKGQCGSLEQVLCSDDVNGFAAETTLQVSAGETYYIEVADWQLGVGNAPLLNFGALLEPVNSRWDTLETKPLSPAISRHATVARGDKLYVVGGQTGGAGVPFVSNNLWRLNTTTNVWETMAPIPGAGYSNTTAALVNNNIYLPSGFSGSSAGYDGLHWRYSIANNSWSLVASIPQNSLPNGRPFAWAASAVPPANNRYYLMGGITSTAPLDPLAEVSRETYSYFPEFNTWSKVDPMQAARYAHTASWVSLNNLGACVAGGLGVQPGEEGGESVAILHRSAECYLEGLGWRFIGDMKIPRFGAGSATGPDGRWYVFGGITIVENVLVPVLQTEVYDPRLNTWTVLPPEYNLGAQELLSARAYPRGSVIGNTLYVTGGSIFLNGENALPLTEKITIPRSTLHLPSLFGQYNDFARPDDNFEQARGIAFGVPQSRNFDSQRDFYDFYTFNLTRTQRVTIDLEVPEDNNFDLFLYGENKLLWGQSAQPFNGEDERIRDLQLEPRRYYIMVKRSFPTERPDQGAAYRISLRN